MAGKAYANRRPEKERPESDFYPTPMSLGWILAELGELDNDEDIWEPACGNGQLARALQMGTTRFVHQSDIQQGVDFLADQKPKPFIVTNPPFSLFDSFVNHAREVADKWIFIGKLNFFAAHERNISGTWRNLRHVYIFDRQVDYRTPSREDGLFHVGNLATGWFVFDKHWTESYWTSSLVDVQKYAKLGAYK